MNGRSLLVKLGKKYPVSLCEPWDHCVHQIGKIKSEVKTILLCLDFDEIVYKYMEDNDLFNKVDLIITHHPFIFGTIYSVTKNDEKKKKLVEKVIEKNLTIYSYHTNFDTAIDGMNDTLANKLELEDIKPLPTCPMARRGKLKKTMNIYDFAKYAKQKLNVDYGLLLDYGKKDINTVAIIGGGGSGFFTEALKDDVDIYISGDCPHHIRRNVVSSNYNYLDLPHEIEKIFINKMGDVLLKMDPILEIIKVDHEEEPKVII